nr:Hsp20 family protein [Bacillus subtilis]
MSLVPYDLFRQLSNMRREFDRFFSELPISFDNEHGIGGIRVDVHETENEVVATCDLDGVKATYKNGILEITMPKVAKDVKKKIDVSFQ